MANLLHENKKMTVFEALEVLEALEFKYRFVAGESVSTANIIIFPPKNDGIDQRFPNCVPQKRLKCATKISSFYKTLCCKLLGPVVLLCQRSSKATKPYILKRS